METNLKNAFAEAKLLANKRSEIQQKRFAEFCEAKRLKLIRKLNSDDSKS